MENVSDPYDDFLLGLVPEGDAKEEDLKMAEEVNKVGRTHGMLDRW